MVREAKAGVDVVVDVVVAMALVESQKAIIVFLAFCPSLRFFYPKHKVPKVLLIDLGKNQTLC